MRNPEYFCAYPVISWQLRIGKACQVLRCGEFDSKPTEFDLIFLDFPFQKAPHKRKFFHPLTSILEVPHGETSQNLLALFLTGNCSVGTLTLLFIVGL